MRGSKSVDSHKQILKSAIGILCAIILNIVLSFIVKYLGLPLFLDNVGTLLAAVMGGYLPGIIAGYLTNVFNMINGTENVFYASISALIAVAAAFFAQRKFFDKFWKSLLTIPVFAFIGGVLGSCFTYLMYGFDMGEGISAPLTKRFLLSGTLSVFEAELLSDVLIDLLDKTITVIIVFFILKVIPDKVKESFNLTGWKQRPFTKDEYRKASKSVSRKASLEKKVIWIIAGVMLVIACVTTTICSLLFHSFAMRQYAQTATSTAELVAASIDPEYVDDFLTLGEDAGHYESTKDKLELIMKSSPEIKYIYAYRIEPDGCHVVFDLDTEDLEGGKPGEVIDFDQSFEVYIPDLLAGLPIGPIISDDTYGWLLTVYAPVLDEAGNCVCFAGCDISVADIRINEVSFVTKAVALFAGFFILILAICMWLLRYHVVYPINAMTIAAKEFTVNSDKERSESVKRFEDLDIRTGDEIENLYGSVLETMEESVDQMEKIKENGEHIAKMQNGLITVLADLVEGRDKNTGDHVKKTSEYTELILRKMQKKGLYPDIITDRYVEDVANSASLHDIGKIMVPDAILNKNGRLDDEEFKTMKSHTTAGSGIIGRAIALVSDAGYLDEAKNLATYHHEKWDGSGYPEGLSGEDIPLSARVMAIADVFDALVSKRSYKPPFSIDEAVDIIKQGSGTHFDPVIVDVFLENLDEISEIAKRHGETYNEG